jgi:hypothetical protein
MARRKSRRFPFLVGLLALRADSGLVDGVALRNRLLARQALGIYQVFHTFLASQREASHQ